MLPFYSKLTPVLPTVRLNKLYIQRFLSLSQYQQNEDQDIKFVLKVDDKKQVEKYNSSLEKQYYRKQDTNYQRPQPEIVEEPIKQEEGFVRSKSALDKRAFQPQQRLDWYDKIAQRFIPKTGGEEFRYKKGEKIPDIGTKAEIQMGRTYMRVYAILFGTLIGFTTYFYTIQDMKAKMQTESVQLEYIGGAPGGYKGGKAKNEAEVTSK